MIVAALICSLAAFALFGCATEAHHLKRFGRRPTPVRRVRMRQIAWIALILSFGLSVAARGWVFGPVVWPGLLMLAAGAVFLCLNLVPEPKRGNR